MPVGNWVEGSRIHDSVAQHGMLPLFIAGSVHKSCAQVLLVARGGLDSAGP